MKKIVLAIGGASGSIYARLLLERLRALDDQVGDCGLIMSENALVNWELEQPGIAPESYGFKVYDPRDFNAPFASGSARYETMIVCPCSMGVLGRIAHGVSDDLTTRAADVILKERRKLILVLRETPYSLIHIENMRLVTLAGGVICPATPSFYSGPSSIDGLAATVVDRVLDLAGLDISTYRWGEQSS
ncbi:MAG: UbiX family flavin prenyltransferase [Saprospiraceae bacterium]|nr:UbiX family flavin prenyltransferase [Saprospiraceae bacterium]